MRVLFVSNFFPPDVMGGYELWCQEVALALSQRGHEVTVVTSRSRKPVQPQPETAPNFTLHRILELEVNAGLISTIARLGRRRQLEAANLREVEKLISRVRPDAALIWGMWNVPRSVPAFIERLLPNRVAYYFCDYWPSLPSAFIQQLQAPARRRALNAAKGLVAAVLARAAAKPMSAELRLDYPICVSRAVRRLLSEAGVAVSHAEVIYGGTPPDESRAREFARGMTAAPTRLLYLGRLSPEKGVHTAIRAIRILQEKSVPVVLDVYGRGNPGYEAELKRLAAPLTSAQSVRFHGGIPREKVPSLLRKHEILVFPSEWQEPFARTVLEAMAAGLAVVGTTTGGTGEILTDGKTGLGFRAGDAEELADRIRVIASDGDLRRRLARAGRQLTLERFTFRQMVDQLEGALEKIARANPAHQALRRPSVPSKVTSAVTV